MHVERILYIIYLCRSQWHVRYSGRRTAACGSGWQRRRRRWWSSDVELARRSTDVVVHSFQHVRRSQRLVQTTQVSTSVVGAASDSNCFRCRCSVVVSCSSPLCHTNSFIIYRVGQKPDCFLKVDNFATVNGKKACNMSTFSEFCLEKSIELICQCIFLC